MTQIKKVRINRTSPKVMCTRYDWDLNPFVDPLEVVEKKRAEKNKAVDKWHAKGKQSRERNGRADMNLRFGRV